MENGGLRGVEVAHRRWGKDDVALHFTATKAIQKVGNYWHMLPQYGQARKVVWNAINPKTGKRRIDEAFPPEIRKKTHQQEMLIELANGSIWQLVGSDNYNSIVGSPPLGLVMSEYSIANPMAWAYLMPILEENGGWALFIYTSRGNNHGKMMYDHACKTPGWYGERLTALDTDVFTPDQLVNIRQEYINLFGEELGVALYEQEYMCSWTGAIFGAYFGKQMSQARTDGRITKVPHTTGVEVDTMWDLGIDDSMSIWFIQPVGKSFNVIDYYENQGFGLEHYAKALKGTLEGSEHRKNYVYGNHWMPHDVNNREMTNSEVAKSRKEVAEDLGISPIEVVQRARSMDQIIQVHIPACRNILNSCWFDEERCSKGVLCLENYRAKYDEEKKVLSNHPVHDWSIHGADAFRTFAVGYNDVIKDTNISPLENVSPLVHTNTGWMA
jgi:hypothetical protein